jgi:alpha-ketoglutarate-dependent taurine dioxygenase
MSKQQLESSSRASTWAERGRGTRPKPISLSQPELVKTGLLNDVEVLPLVIKPQLAGLIDLFAWASSHSEFIESNLMKYGAFLFRGFNLHTQEDFERFLTAISLPRMHYMEGATPRTDLGGRIYTSTEYPAEHSIALHNELNYVMTWPMKIFFFCVTPAEQGGATPIADVRRVFNRIPPRIRQPFIEKGWMLIRNFGDGLSLPWRTAFRVEDKAALEDYCRSARVSYEWKGGDRLRTRQVRPVVRYHPKTNEPVWFNHVAFWHVSSLEPKVREMFLGEFSPEDLPFNACYGDGTPIEDEVVAELRHAYDEETVAFPWQTGDLLMIDNMLVAHGRQPYAGARKILAAMGEPLTGD